MTISAATRLYSDLALDVYYGRLNVHRPVASDTAVRQSVLEADFKSTFAGEGDIELLGLAAYQHGKRMHVRWAGQTDALPAAHDGRASTGRGIQVLGRPESPPTVCRTA
jgi:hypothetical protein